MCYLALNIVLFCSKSIDIWHLILYDCYVDSELNCSTLTASVVLTYTHRNIMCEYRSSAAVQYVLCQYQFKQITGISPFRYPCSSLALISNLRPSSSVTLIPINCVTDNRQYCGVFHEPEHKQEKQVKSTIVLNVI